jgi:hypothetical protein
MLASGKAMDKPAIRRKMTPRTKRFVLYLLVLLAVVAWRYVPRPWHPGVTRETPHHVILSSASAAETEDMARVLELLYGAYSNRFAGVPSYQRDHPRLQVKLFKDRDEFRRVNPGLGWAEAYYQYPCCRAYYSAGEINPYQWMIHESVHQLNNEVAHLGLEKWLDEGLAEYFSTSRFISNRLAPGRIDVNTYPVWWLDELATSDSLPENLKNGSVIPLRQIITDRGGPGMNQHFNLYYLHWWTLTHFLFESPQYRDRAMTLAEQGGGLEAFEKLIGPVDAVQPQWHEYVRRLKSALSRGDVHYFKTGVLPGATNGPTSP